MDNLNIEQLVESSKDRFNLWVQIANMMKAKYIAEVGVYKGDFARYMLGNVPSIESYILIDPWRHIPGWNEPTNTSDENFERVYQEAVKKLSPFKGRYQILRGTTSEVSHKIKEDSLDIAYIDGDHTLRGITIDLYHIYHKVREGGIIGGDDFLKTIWHHSLKYEPSFVFPYAVYFAEAIGVPIHALPFNQFLIIKDRSLGFRFIDHTNGKYRDTSVRKHLSIRWILRRQLIAISPTPLIKIVNNTRKRWIKKRKSS